MRALRRTHPQAEIHLLTRSRFQDAVQGLNGIDRHWTLASKEILAPLVQENADVNAAMTNMSGFVNELKNQNYDQVINLTFSALSSYLTHAIAGKNAQTLGYTRHADGSFNPNDDVGAYFYAQVGIDKPNRVHIADIFASMMGVEFVESDWAAPKFQDKLSLPEGYLAVHIGASEKHKSLTPQFWNRVIHYIIAKNPQLSIVLIGAPNEQSIAEQVMQENSPSHIVNLVGKTKVQDLFEVISHADMLIGCDSAPIHIASLTDTPTFNISLGNVNFWETGPKASLSFILRAQGEHELTPMRTAEIANQLLQGYVVPELIIRSGGLTSYKVNESAMDAFQWNLVRALYLGGDYPMVERVETIQGAMKLDEINNFAMEQIEQIPARGLDKVIPFLQRAEEIIQTMNRFVPELSPMISWFNAEKARIQPGSQEEIRTATLNVHERFKRFLQVYIPQENFTDEGVDNGAF
jgi:ADP-heptose:LPS heptosyltransferase